MSGMRTCTAMAALVAAVAFSNSTPVLAQSAWNQISETGVFRIGVIPARPPYMWQKLGSDDWEGFTVEMAKNVVDALSHANAMNKAIKLTYVPTSFQTVVLDIQSNRLDAFFGFSITEKRKEAIDMFGPLYALAHVLINRDGFYPGDKWEDYNKPDVKVSFALGTTDQDTVKKLLPKATQLGMRNESEAIMSVQSSNADAFSTTVLTGLASFQLNPNFSRMVVAKPVEMSNPSGGGVRKDGEGRLHSFMQAWAWSNHQAGISKAMIIDSIHKAGMDPSKLPPEMKF